MKYQLRILDYQIDKLYNHLFPGDKLEAVSLLICGFHINNGMTILTVRDIFNVPYQECIRDQDYIKWKTDTIIPVLERAAFEGASILKIHSHPTGYDKFSELDDESDLNLIPSIYGWVEGDNPHGSMVMLPDKKIFGRIISYNKEIHDIQKISIVGDYIKILQQNNENGFNKSVSLRNMQTFGLKTTKTLKNLKIGVIGASGTGSPLIEQLVRLGVGKIVIVDPDIIEEKNLNRIINAKIEDCKNKVLKVTALKKAIDEIGFDTDVVTFSENLYDSREAIEELILCDFIFGCVDSVDGRHLINQISTYYIIPYIDIGVKLEADGYGGISQINGVVHYIKPGGSSLLSRGVYDLKALEAANLFRQNPKEYKERLKEKYISNVDVESPAVISVNMFISSFAINEFLDRIHPFKSTDVRERAANWISITEGVIFNDIDGPIDNYLLNKVGRGYCIPFLEMSEL